MHIYIYLFPRFQQVMFKGWYDKVLDKLSEYNPIRNFIKFALDKFLNQFLSKKLTLGDFANGLLNLSNLDLNADKINQKALVGSPYILHSGLIGRLQISLPPLSQLSTKSIEVNVTNLQISLKPNKFFYEKFKQKLKQITEENQMFNVEDEAIEGEISENGTTDFFKQFLKQIIMNIKININNVVIKLYMNQPSDQESRVPQFYLMLRIPKVQLDKNDDGPVTKPTEQRFKFKLEIPQISLHLLRDDSAYPQFHNYSSQYTKQDFPFKYPPTSHPSTILLIGVDKLQQTHPKKNSVFHLTITTDYEKKTREFKMKLEVATFECMINPLQLKAVSRFVIQFMQFKKILNYVIDQLGLRKQGHFNQNMEVSNAGIRVTNLRASANHDIFSSMIMSVNHDFRLSKKKSKRQPDAFESFIMGNETMKNDIAEFNKKFKNELKTEKQLQEFTVINFKNIWSLKAQFSLINLYILKYIPDHNYMRYWISGMQLTSEQKINTKIGSCYFLVSLNKSILTLQQDGKLFQFSLKKGKVFNVKLKNGQLGKSKIIQDEEQQFFDIRSSCEFNNGKQVSFEVSLQQFKLGQGQHYCIQQIISISQKSSQSWENQQLKYHSFLPNLQKQKNEQQMIMYEPGVDFVNDRREKKKNLMKIKILEIDVSINAEVLRDVANIIFPIFAYRRLSQGISLKKQTIMMEKGEMKKNKNSIYQSQYDFGNEQYSRIQQFDEANKVPPTFIIDIKQIKITIRESQKSEFQNLIEKQKDKISDHQSFSKKCFCSLNEVGLYAQCYSIQVQIKKQDLKLSFKKLEIGSMLINKSIIKQISSLVKLQVQRADDIIRILKQTRNQENWLSIYLPFILVKIQQKNIMEFSEMVIKETICGKNLFDYFNYLRRQMKAINNEFLDEPSKKKKQSYPKKSFGIELNVRRTEIYFLFLNAQIIDLFFTNYHDEILVKFDFLAIFYPQHQQFRVTKLRHKEMMLKDYTNSKIGIGRQCDIVLMLGQRKQFYQTFETRNRQAYFNKLHTDQKAFGFRLIKKECKNKHEHQKAFQIKMDRAFSAKFGFKNKKVNSIIEEEQEQQKVDLIMTIDTLKIIYINTANAIELAHKKENFERIGHGLSKLKQKLDVLKKQPVMQRKQSVDIVSNQVDITVSIYKINIDTRPYYFRNGQSITFGNTRSILSITNPKIKFCVLKENTTKHLNVSIPLVKLYFLSHEDNQPTLNPLIVKDNEIINFGFRTILNINDFDLNAKIDNKNTMLFKIGLKDISLNLAAETIILVLNHLQHFTKHNVNKNYSWVVIEETYQEFDIKEQMEMKEINQKFDESEDQDLSDQVQDLSDALGLYKKKIQQKRSDEIQFRSRAFVLKQRPNLNIMIEQFKIQQIELKIYSGKDFQFFQHQTLGQSLQRKRERNQDVNMLKYLLVVLQKLSTQLQIIFPKKPNEEISLFSITSFQLLEISLSDKRVTTGFLTGYLYSIIRRNQYEQQIIFTIFKNESEVKVLFNMMKEKIQFKTFSVILSLGFTSDILEFVDQIKRYNQEQVVLGWKKIYDEPKKIKSQSTLDKRILLLLPETKLILTIEYNNIGLLNCQSIKTEQLFLNEQIKNNSRMQALIKKWVKNLIKNNIAGIIGGKMTEALGKILDLILGCIRVIFEVIFG